MWMRMTCLCAAVAALSACASVAPGAPAQGQAQAAPVLYPSEHNQLRELGWL